MQFTFPHKFTRTEAKSRINNMLAGADEQLKEKKVIIDKKEWVGDVLNFAFTAEGQHITGSVSVEDNQYAITAKLPFMLRLFEGKIEKAIKEQVAGMLK